MAVKQVGLRAKRTVVVTYADFGRLLPDDAIVAVNDISNDVAQPANVRRIAGRLMLDISTATPLDPYDQGFVNIVNGMVAVTLITQEEADAILETLRNM